MVKLLSRTIIFFLVLFVTMQVVYASSYQNVNFSIDSNIVTYKVDTLSPVLEIKELIKKNHDIRVEKQRLVSGEIIFKSDLSLAEQGYISGTTIVLERKAGGGGSLYRTMALIDEFDFIDMRMYDGVRFEFGAGYVNFQLRNLGEKALFQHVQTGVEYELDYSTLNYVDIDEDGCSDLLITPGMLNGDRSSIYFQRRYCDSWVLDEKEVEEKSVESNYEVKIEDVQQEVVEEAVEVKSIIETKTIDTEAPVTSIVEKEQPRSITSEVESDVRTTKLNSDNSIEGLKQVVAFAVSLIVIGALGSLAYLYRNEIWRLYIKQKISIMKKILAYQKEQNKISKKENKKVSKKAKEEIKAAKKEIAANLKNKNKE